MNSDIEFLKNLQNELNTQSNDCQASPRFWTVGDYKWVACSSDNAERYSIFLPNDGDSYEINYFLEKVLDREELSEKELESLAEISCEESTLDWIQEHYDDGASLHPEREEHCIRENTMFLTKEEAKRHIELNHYHYTEKAHTYAMTAWRAPKVERLLKILSEFDFDMLHEVPSIPTELLSEAAAETDLGREGWRVMIDKQKLLDWISDKKYVFAVDDYDHAADDYSPYEVGMWAGCMKVLNMIQRDIELGEFGVEEVAHERSEASSASAARTQAQNDSIGLCSISP